MFTQTDEALAWKQIRRARTNLSDYLATLNEEQWDQPSLCEGWKVRDVVAHLILEYHYQAGDWWWDFVTSGFRINKFMLRTAIKHGRQPAAELLKQFQAMRNEQIKPLAIPTINVLVDTLVHEQDIRLALNQPQTMNVESLRLIFSHWEPGDYNLGERITGVARRIRGLQFTITDLDIQKGTGAEVCGKAQDILLAVVGRAVALDGLEGEGLGILRKRLV